MLLERGLQPWIEDIGRRAGLGPVEAARELALGIVEGLGRAGRSPANGDRLLSWAPDFVDENVTAVLRAVHDA